MSISTTAAVEVTVSGMSARTTRLGLMRGGRSRRLVLPTTDRAGLIPSPERNSENLKKPLGLKSVGLPIPVEQSRDGRAVSPHLGPKSGVAPTEVSESPPDHRNCGRALQSEGGPTSRDVTHAASMLSDDSAVKRHVWENTDAGLPFVSMSASTPGEESTLGERLKHAIYKERHRGPTAVESALIVKHPELFRSRGFLSSYIGGRRGAKNPDPKAMKAIADFLHVNFEWLVLGSGPMRKGGRGETPAEEALFIARDWGIREDAWQLAWEANKHRAESMSAEEWFDAIRSAATKLDREGVPRPESIVAAKDDQRRIRRAKKKLVRPPPDPAPSEPRTVAPAIPPPPPRRRVAAGR